MYMYKDDKCLTVSIATRVMPEDMGVVIHIPDPAIMDEAPNVTCRCEALSTA